MNILGLWLAKHLAIVLCNLEAWKVFSPRTHLPSWQCCFVMTIESAGRLQSLFGFSELFQYPNCLLMALNI